MRWTTRLATMVPLLALALLAGCAEKADQPRVLAGADAGRGLALVRANGCAACHAVPGVAWPRGEVGGPLAGFADRPLIAGRLPNQPRTLVAWLRDPPALSPGAAMPATGLSEAQARDVAAYLYTLDGR
ncbi:c-type cytochrome [Caulobacter sp. LARHSG274]